MAEPTRWPISMGDKIVYVVEASDYDRLRLSREEYEEVAAAFRELAIGRDYTPEEEAILNKLRNQCLGE